MFCKCYLSKICNSCYNLVTELLCNKKVLLEIKKNLIRVLPDENIHVKFHEKIHVT